MYRVEVVTSGDTEWVSSGMTFDTMAEAESYGRGLFARWFAVIDWRVVSIDTPRNQNYNG